MTSADDMPTTWREILDDVRHCFGDIDAQRGDGRFSSDITLSAGMLASQQALRGIASYHVSRDGGFQ
jgi:hypothetical protein